MDELGKWLDELGLGAYAAVFAENAIDAEILSDLTDADLKELGIPLSHRKKLLKAIAALDAAGDGAPIPRADSSPSLPGTEASLAAWKRKPGERRLVTGYRR